MRRVAVAPNVEGTILPDVPARVRYLTPGEVADLFRVDSKTVTRWAADGRIPSIRTPGGHHRFPEDEIHAIIEASRIRHAAGS